jgi:hypothetical protein
MSLVETFQMPLREIKERFTWSEIVLMGWRSQEQTHQLKSKSGNIRSWKEDKANVKQRKAYAEGEIPANLPDRFFNEEGEVDLRKVTGRDAVQYLAAVGIHVPIGGGVSRS